MTIDRGALEQQLESLGDGSRWWDQREMRDLPAVLHNAERIVAISHGRVARPRWLRRSWLIVVTDQRLLCLRSARRAWMQLEVTPRQIARVALRIGPFKGRVLVVSDSHTFRLLVPRNDAYKLQAALLQLATPGRERVEGFGPTRVLRGMIDHVLALPAAALAPATQMQTSTAFSDTAAMNQRLQQLEEQVQQLAEQVDFLEQLLRERGTPSA